MIISRTPVRISFFGGGTDIKEFYSKSYGAVLSTAIKKYIYVAVNKKFDDNIRVSYSETEIVDSVDKIKHPIIRECLKHKGIKGKIEVVSIADIPGYGSGLGSSSTLTVGVLNALNFYTNVSQTHSAMAEEACKIELEDIKKSGGKQDQYIAALGGFRYIKFHPDESVTTELVSMPDNELEELKSNLVSFYITGSREANDILSDQTKNIVNRMKVLEEMRDQAERGRDILRSGDLTAFGKLLNKAWELKSTLSSKISTPAIAKYYSKGLSAGALGGKLSGAGGSGFLTFYCEKERQAKLREELRELKEMKIDFEPEGTRILYYDS